MKRQVMALAGMLSAATCTLMASCAANDDAEPPKGDTSTLPEAAPGSDAGNDADADVDVGAGCNGAAWCMVPTSVSPLSVLKAIWGTGKNDIWAAGSGGAIAHYDGTTWSTIPSGVKHTFNAIWGSSPNDVYLVAAADAIFHTTGANGASATLTPLPVKGLGVEGTRIHAIWGTSPADVRLGSDYYDYLDLEANERLGSQFVLSKDDKGDGGGARASGWSPVPFATGDQPDTLISSIWGSSSTDIWMAASQWNVPGREAVMFHGQAARGGLGLTEVDSQSSSPLESIHGTSSTDVWAVGAGGTIRHFGAGNSRWQLVDSPTTETLHAVWASAPNDVWAVGDKGTIIHYDGKTFAASSAELPQGRTPTLYGIWGSGPNDVWIVGDAIVLHYTGPSGSTGGTP
ncbi:Type IV fimbrial biogenesis protein PilY1 [Labilithrix luteola]|uniref:Type IV fimbrial biogenesis protein PilY1 n=1 Tax=Labilithrix luteola TaxID=1391654 RepID=A0A0K1PMY6_9BACT|nr:hypothetical protein [Labilithrix luteola]AKU94905.1 Type IV fimbrial biogenesis protein PilY1 [Labilithrix luteola]